MLGDLNCRYIVASNAEEALQSIAQFQFDLILMDVQLPDISGVELTQRIRQMPQFKHIPIIAVTAHAYSEMQEEFMGSGMDDVLTKPIMSNRLEQKLRQWIRK